MASVIIDNQILEISEKLIAVVETVMNPNVPHAQRLEAHQQCEDFKENSPLCAQCGLQLASKTNSAIIRHFGLQLLEHCVKYRWHTLTQEDKIFIKVNAMSLLAQGTHPILVEQAHVKDALSRIIVEMIKREWPQQWPKLLLELDELCQMGAKQTELVLLILLRLAEDIVTFQNLQNIRRREIYQALVTNMKGIFRFMMQLLKIHVDQYQQLKETAVNDDDKEMCLSHCKVSQCVLLTLTGYVEWVLVEFIIAYDGLLLQMLCVLLSDENLHLYAAECMLQIVNRKGKLEDRKPLLILFNEDVMRTIFNAVRSASGNPLDENHYVFLKKLCQVLIGIGNQLFSLWGSKAKVNRPPNFGTYLDAILAFTQHPSQILSSYTQPLWYSFFRHEEISQDPLVLERLPKVLESATLKLMKVGFPSRSDSPSCQYASLDFDSDEDFMIFFLKYRTDIADVVRLAAFVCPTVAFNFAARWLELLLHKPIDIGEGGENGLCNLASPSYLEWDALTVFFECALTKIFTSAKEKPPTEDGIKLLKGVLDYNSEDPLILSCLLSCISSLFIFLTFAPEALSAVLEKIFVAAVFSFPGLTKATRNRAVKNVRRHACSSLVKICKQYPDLILPHFEQIYNHVKNVSVDPDQLSQMEKCTLMEALVLLSNQFKDYSKQAAFIEEILQPVTQFWLSADVTEAILSPEKFMTFIGLDKEPVEPSQDDVVGINRSQLVYCLNMILGVVKRSTWPTDEAAVKGGFVKGYHNGVPIFTNPATPSITILYNNLLFLLRTFNALWLPEILARTSPQYARAHDLLDIDRMAVLGVNTPCVDISDPRIMKQPLERMQSFMCTAHDTCYHIMGNICQALGYEFYAAPNCVSSIIDCACSNIEIIPDYRLRPILRFFFKPLAQCCPVEYYESHLVPILLSLCPRMYERLKAKWQIINQRYDASLINEEDTPESQEILEDQLTRQVTKEYIELLVAVCQFKKIPETSFNDMMVDDDGEHHKTSFHDDFISDLGKAMMKNETLCTSITLCVFSALYWNDSSTCNKSVHLCWLLLKQLIADQTISFDGANHLLLSIFLGLQQHGQHDTNCVMLVNLALSAYECLKPIFPEIKSIMLNIPGCTEEDLQMFDDKFVSCTPKQFPEKKKKEIFKRLIAGAIGQSIGQKFKKDLHIVNLQPFLKPKKRPSPPKPDLKDMGLETLFGPNDI